MLSTHTKNTAYQLTYQNALTHHINTTCYQRILSTYPIDTHLSTRPFNTSSQPSYQLTLSIHPTLSTPSPTQLPTHPTTNPFTRRIHGCGIHHGLQQQHEDHRDRPMHRYRGARIPLQSARGIQHGGVFTRSVHSGFWQSRVCGEERRGIVYYELGQGAWRAANHFNHPKSNPRLFLTQA